MKTKSSLSLAFEELEAAEAAEVMLKPFDEVGRDESVSELQDLADDLTVGTNIAEASDTIVSGLEASIEKGEGIDENAALITQAAVESFYRTLDYKPSVNALASENFTLQGTRLDKAKLAMESIVTFNTKLKTKIAIASENFLNSVSSNFSRTTEDIDVIDKRLQSAVHVFEQKGNISGPISAHGWGKSFGLYVKSDNQDSSAIASRLDSVAKAFSKHRPTDAVKKMSSIIVTMTQALNKKGAETASVSSSISKGIENIDACARDVNSVLNTGASGDHVEQLTPVSNISEAKLLASKVENILGELKAFTKAWSDMDEKLAALKGAAERFSSRADLSEPERKTTWRWVLGLAGIFTGPGIILMFLAGFAVDAINHRGAIAKNEREKVARDGFKGPGDTPHERVMALVEVSTELLKLCNAAVVYIEKSTNK